MTFAEKFRFVEDNFSEFTKILYQDGDCVDREIIGTNYVIRLFDKHYSVCRFFKIIQKTHYGAILLWDSVSASKILEVILDLKLSDKVKQQILFNLDFFTDDHLPL